MRVRLTVLAGLLCMVSPLTAAEDSEPPSLELLEYLGGWEDAQGNWVDPGLLGMAAVEDAGPEGKSDDEQDDD